jgi:hypothetical protein
VKSGFFSFTSLSQLVGGLALVGLLLYGWTTGQQLPLWPSLLVVGVNVVLAVRLVLEIKARSKGHTNPQTDNAPPGQR